MEKKNLLGTSTNYAAKESVDAPKDVFSLSEVELISFGADLKAARENMGMSQSELARACGYSDNSTISHMEDGRFTRNKRKRAMVMGILFSQLSALGDKWPELRANVVVPTGGPVRRSLPATQSLSQGIAAEQASQEVWVVSQSLVARLRGGLREIFLGNLRQGHKYFYITGASEAQRARGLIAEMERELNPAEPNVTIGISSDELALMGAREVIITDPQDFQRAAARLRINESLGDLVFGDEKIRGAVEQNRVRLMHDFVRNWEECAEVIGKDVKPTLPDWAV